MYKKVISIIVISFFLIFSYSCYSTKMIDGIKIKSGRNKNTKIFGVATLAGKWISFEGGEGARIIDRFVIGQVRDESGTLKILRVPTEIIAKAWVTKLDKKKTILRVLGAPMGILYSLLMVAWIFGDFMGD